MPPRALVRLRFGPYRSCGLVAARPFRLQGLQGHLSVDLPVDLCRHLNWPTKIQHLHSANERIDPVQPPTVLQADGHKVILEKIPDWNNVEVIVNGETVFQCNINDLDFGGDGKLDPLCEEARIAVLKAY